MLRRWSTVEYLEQPEQMTPQELVWGVLREPPAPLYGHQSVVGRVFVILDVHNRAHRLGIVCVSPMDVVLDPARALVVQPDVFFVAKERIDLIRGQMWGAPDLVVEVASRRTMRRDRTTKLAWYRRYGVKECWLVEPGRERVVIVDLSLRGRKAYRIVEGPDRLRSTVLPLLHVTAADCFP